MESNFDILRAVELQYWKVESAEEVQVHWSGWTVGIISIAWTVGRGQQLGGTEEGKAEGSDGMGWSKG